MTTALLRSPGMNRRSFLRGAIGAAVLTSPALAWAARQPADPAAAPKAPALPFDTAKIEAIKLEDDLYVLMGQGGNVAAHWDGEVLVVVDAGVPSRGAELAAKTRAFSDAPRRVLINTHWHFDHTGGNPAFAAAGFTVVATAKTRQRMSAPQRLAALGMDFPASPGPALPVLTFTDTLDLEVAGAKVRVEGRPPAHTDTDAIVLFGAHDVIHGGDIFFNGGFPVVDTGTGGSIEGMIAALTDIRGRCTPKTRIIPGHGPMATPDDVAAAAGLMSTVRDRLKPLADKGETLDAVLANDPLADLNDKWGRGLVRSQLLIKMVYGSMLAKK